MIKAESWLKIGHMILIALIAWLFESSLDLFLYLRPSPMGDDYVANTLAYLNVAVFYNAFGVALISFPLCFVALFLRKRSAALAAVQITLLALHLLLSHIDNEVYRFLSVHPSYDWFKTYVQFPMKSGVDNVFVNDQGGPWLSFFIVALIPLFVMAAVIVQRKKLAWLEKIPNFVAWLAVLVASVFSVAIPSYYFFIRGPSARQVRVAPPAYLLFVELGTLSKSRNDYSDIENNVSDFKKLWLKANNDPNWVFDDDPRSLRKSYRGQCKQYGDKAWNFIFLVMESYRSVNLKFLNPDAPYDVSTNLEKIAKSRYGSYYTRFFCNGYPSIFANTTFHTGIPAHSNRTVVSSFTGTDFQSFTDHLRRAGYTALAFSACDPDYDHFSRWGKKWYDSVYYDAGDKGLDHVVLGKMLAHLDTLPKDRPFFATFFSFTNHTPFINPDPKYEIYRGNVGYQKIWNTMKYNDAILMDFFNALQSKDYADNTVLVIVADHGVDLGERIDGFGYSPHHNTTWIPLIFHGKHPLLKYGPQNQIASQHDLAPTFLELAGICADNTFTGHSLFSVSDDYLAYSAKDFTYSVNTPEYSSGIDDSKKAELYRQSDMLQTHNIADEKIEIFQEHRRIAKLFATVIDYFYENNLFDMALFDMPGTNSDTPK